MDDRVFMPTILLSPSDAGTQLSNALARLGASLVTWPELKINIAENGFALDEAIENLFGYDWLILKNDCAAKYFLRRFRKLNSADDLDHLRVLVIGETAAEQLIESQIHVDIALDRFSARDVFRAIEAYLGGGDSLAGLNVLIPGAGLGSEDFASRLAGAGARVDRITAYQTTNEKYRLGQLKALMLGGGLTGVAFTSTTTVEEMGQLFDTKDLSSLLAEIRVSCRDAETRDTARRFGLAETSIPAGPSVENFANLILSRTA